MGDPAQSTAMPRRRCPTCGTAVPGPPSRWRWCSEACRFAAKVDHSAGPLACWPWTGALSPSGYGRFKPAGAPLTTAPRAAFRYAYGEVPVGLRVYHRCGDPRCVNPLHLFLGSAAVARDRPIDQGLINGYGHTSCGSEIHPAR